MTAISTHWLNDKQYISDIEKFGKYLESYSFLFYNKYNIYRNVSHAVETYDIFKTYLVRINRDTEDYVSEAIERYRLKYFKNYPSRNKFALFASSDIIQAKQYSYEHRKADTYVVFIPQQKYIASALPYDAFEILGIKFDNDYDEETEDNIIQQVQKYFDDQELVTFPNIHGLELLINCNSYILANLTFLTRLNHYFNKEIIDDTDWADKFKRKSLIE